MFTKTSQSKNQLERISAEIQSRIAHAKHTNRSYDRTRARTISVPLTRARQHYSSANNRLERQQHGSAREARVTSRAALGRLICLRQYLNETSLLFRKSWSIATALSNHFTTLSIRELKTLAVTVNLRGIFAIVTPSQCVRTRHSSHELNQNRGTRFSSLARN